MAPLQFTSLEHRTKIRIVNWRTQKTPMNWSIQKENAATQLSDTEDDFRPIFSCSQSDRARMHVNQQQWSIIIIVEYKKKNSSNFFSNIR